MRLLMRPGMIGLPALAALLAACGGNIGSSSPPMAPQQIQPPQVPQQVGYRVPATPGPTPAKGTVELTDDLTTVTFPSAGGYGLAIVLRSPSPSPSPSPSAAPTAAKKKAAKSSSKGHPKKLRSPASRRVPHTPAPPTAAAAVPAPSGALPGTPAASGDASALPLGTPLADVTGSPKPPVHATIEMLVVAFPAKAATAPTAAPSASPLPSRHAMIRAELKSQTGFTIPSFDALVFSIPAAEQTAGRGFSIVVLEQGKKRRESLLVSNTNASLDAGGNVHTIGAADAIPIVANRRYIVMLYADDPIATPLPLPANYGQPGVMSSGSPLPGTTPSAAPRQAPVDPNDHGD